MRSVVWRAAVRGFFLPATHNPCWLLVRTWARGPHLCRCAQRVWRACAVCWLLTISCFAQILLGLNFYGWKFHEGDPSSAVLGSEFVKLLRENKGKLSWDDKAHEHRMKLGKDSVLWYPTPKVGALAPLPVPAIRSGSIVQCGRQSVQAVLRLCGFYGCDGGAPLLCTTLNYRSVHPCIIVTFLRMPSSVFSLSNTANTHTVCEGARRPCPAAQLRPVRLGARTGPPCILCQPIDWEGCI